jgi:predicted DNA-binding transcriptional regulator YafY
MRADRLISLLMLLQSRGRMKAHELAEVLEVSERTVYRDIDALSAAGVPVYGECGREGGFALIDSYHTRLTGMTDEELRILFMLRIPEPLHELGFSQDLKQALLKLSASLPDSRRAVEDEIRLRFYLDSSGWEQRLEPIPHLPLVYQAVREDRTLNISYQPMFNVILDQTVEPYGLVAKGGDWYLIYSANGKMNVRRVSELLEACIGEGKFIRPPEFDVAVFWKEWCTQQALEDEAYRVTVRVLPSLIPYIFYVFGYKVNDEQIEKVGRGMGIIIELAFESLEAARSRLLPLGAGVEVLQPEGLRCSIKDYAEQISRIYSAKSIS